MKADRNIADFLAQGVKNGVFSGAQAAWCAGRNTPVSVACTGTTHGNGTVEITPRTLFDIASVTKLFAASAALRVADRNQLVLGAPLRTLNHSLAPKKYGKATLAELLAHEAGFVDWLPLFEQVPPAERGTPAARETIIGLAMTATPSALPGEKTVYSDLGFIVLTHLLETACNASLDHTVTCEIMKPLGLAGARYNRALPDDGLDIAATENCPWRGRVLTGEVHDDNAWSMGGISAHAGIFATASDVAALGAAWLESLKRDGFISRDLAVQATTRRPLGRGLGWDFKSQTGSSAGSRFSPQSFGHLGFTGCSLWVDPERNVSVALNTNRVHFGRDNLLIREFRPAFHDLLIETLEV